MTPARMIFLGFGKYARADKIYALEPLVGDERGGVGWQRGSIGRERGRVRVQ